MNRMYRICSILTLAASTAAGASSITYEKGRGDSINLDLQITEITHKEDGTLVLRAKGEIAKTAFQLKLTVGVKWKIWQRDSNPQTPIYESDMQILPDGVGSRTLDALVRSSFNLDEDQTFFSPKGYSVLCVSNRKDLERERVKFWANDAGDLTIQVAVDVPKLSLRLAIFEVAYGRSYPVRVGDTQQDGANQSADSTASAGTSAAEQPRVPASSASHL
jgi:hypothetical protein